MAQLNPSAPTWTGAAVLGLGLGGLWWVLDTVPPADLTGLQILVFVLAAVATELLPMRQPGGRAVATSLAILATLALLGGSPVLVAGIAGVGWLVARLVQRDPLPVAQLALRMVGAWSMAGVVAVGAAAELRWTGRDLHEGATATLDLGAAGAVALAIVVGVPVLQALAANAGRLAFLPRRATEAVARSWMVGAAVSSTALLGGLVHDVLGIWTLPTMLIPLLAARFGLDRFTVAARAYDQTIRAMSRLPEQLGTVDAEHGVRVGRLAHRVGIELGVDADTLIDLEHAAHLHELGRIRHGDDAAELTRADLSAAGASIIRETGSLDRAAAIVAAHGEPRLATGEAALPARILAACCAADRYGPHPGDAGQHQEVLVRLVREVGDLEVVAAISRVFEHRRLAA